MTEEKPRYGKLKKKKIIKLGQQRSGLPVLRTWDFGMRAGALCCQLFDGQLRVLHEVVPIGSDGKFRVSKCKVIRKITKKEIEEGEG